MGRMASQITSLTIVYSTIYSGADRRKHQRFASLAFVQGIHRWPVNSPHKGPVTRKMFPFDDVIMLAHGTTIHNAMHSDTAALKGLYEYFSSQDNDCPPQMLTRRVFFLIVQLREVWKYFFLFVLRCQQLHWFVSNNGHTHYLNIYYRFHAANIFAIQKGLWP